MFEAGPSEEKGPPRESRRGEGGGGGSPPFFGCGPKVPARHVIPLNGTSRFGHKPALVHGYGAVTPTGEIRLPAITRGRRHRRRGPCGAGFGGRPGASRAPGEDAPRRSWG